jgi:hypothetical protein
MGARTGPNHGPMRAFSAIFARTGPDDGPVRALDSSQSQLRFLDRNSRH